MALCLSKTLSRPPESLLSAQRNYNFWIAGQAGQKVDLANVEKLARPSK
jgi:plasmid maintenance system antidote protein VapI